MENKQMELAKVREKWIMSMENASKSRSGRPLRNRSGRQMFPEVVRQRRQVLQGMAKPLKRWLIKHRDNPYPTKAEKISLALGSQMTLMQVSNWFANARRRLKNTVKTPNADWSKRIKLYNSCVVGNAELLSISSDDSIWDSDDIESEIQMIPTIDPNPQDRQTNEDHSYSALEGLMVHSYLPEKSRTSSINTVQQIPIVLSSKTPESQSAPVVKCKRSREVFEDETVFPDEASCKVQYDYRPKKYKRHIMQRYLYDSYRMNKQDEEVTECGNQNVSCQRTEKCSDSVGGSCSESETSPSISRSPSSTCTDSATEFRLSEVEVSQDLLRTKVSKVFSNDRLKNGRYWKEFDAAIVLANLGQTAMVRSSSGSNNPPISTTCS